MAKIKGPLNSVQAGGTVNNVIYARNHYGAYARSYVSPVQPDTAEQLTWRGIMQTINSNWKNPAVITQDLLNVWNHFSFQYPVKDRYGNSRRLAPKEWFTKFNYYRLRAGLSIVTVPPLFPSVSYHPEVTFYWDSGGIYMEVWPRPSAQQFVMVSYTGPHNHTRNFAPQSTQFGGIFIPSTNFPLLVVPAASIDANPHNWFFRYVVVDSFGRSSNKVWAKVYTNGSAPPTRAIFNTINILNNNNPTFVDSNPLHGRALDNGSNLRKTLHKINTTTWNYTSVTKSWFYFKLSITSVQFCELFDTLQSWVVAETTWNEYSLGNTWSSPGGAIGVDYASAPFAVLNTPGLIGVWVRVEVTNQMNTWLAGAVDPIEFWVVFARSILSDYRWEWAIDPTEKSFFLNVPVIV